MSNADDPTVECLVAVNRNVLNLSPIATIRQIVILLLIFAVPQALLAATPTGFWQHEQDPIWIEVREGEGQGVVRRHDNKPEVVDSVMLRNLKPSSSKNQVWHGQVYAPPLGAFKEAEITLVDDNIMTFKVSVGFFSRTVVWTRVTMIPSGDLGD